MVAVTLAPDGRGYVAPVDFALVADAAQAIGLDFVQITKGSRLPADANSGPTHSGDDGVGDIRVWNIPADKVVPLVVELRRRDCAAWLRDEDHGGFDPHIHYVRRGANLAPSAQWQLDEYDRGRDGLSRRGPDYHPRPEQTPFAVVRKVRITSLWTWVYDRSSLASPKLRRILMGWPFEYVEVVRNREGVWLKNRAGNYVWARRTNWKG